MNERIDLNNHKKLWQRTGFWVALWLGLCAVAFSACFLSIPSWLAGDTDIFGNYRFEEQKRQALEELTPIGRVHAQLFPRWLIAEANGAEADAAYAELVRELEDAKLREIVEEMQLILRDGDPVGEQAYLDELVARWNARLQKLEQPYYVSASVFPASAGPAFIGEFYRRLADVDVAVGAAKHPAMILERVDETNVREWYLGVTRPGLGAALVVTDRILDFAIRDVWPILDEDHAPSPDSLAARYAAKVRAEARAALGDEVFATLAESSRWRRQLVDTVRQIEARRACGSTMRFSSEIPWDGYNPRVLDRMDAYAERDKIEPCPAVRFEEADALREASRELGSAANQKALEKLVAWLTRGIAVHEARHVADDVAHDGLQQPLACENCPDWLGVEGRSEASAYLASFAWGDSPVTNFYQACEASRFAGGPHRRAMRFITQALDLTCGQPLPDDFVPRVRALETEIFAERSAVELPANYPTTLPIRRFR